VGSDKYHIQVSHHLRVGKNALNEYDQYAIYLAILYHGAIDMFSVCSNLQAKSMRDGKFWPPTESQPLSRLPQNSAQLIMSAREPPKPNFVQIHLLGASGQMGEI